MFDWLQKMKQRGGHPMQNPAEAAKLLAELPRDEPLKATEEVTAWLESLARSTQFGTAPRLRVISMVDEAGQPAAAALTSDYIAAEKAQRADRFRQWQVLMNFWEKVADAYTELVGYAEIAQRPELKDQLPLITARAMRAVFMQMRLALMRYASEPDRTWNAQYRLFSFALKQHFATSPVRLYSTMGTQTTTARNELVSAVMLEAAGPQTLAPGQIELTSRIVGRLASAFAFSDTPGDRLYYVVDLATSAPPVTIKEDLQAVPTMRFLGPGTVLSRLNELIERIRHPHPTSVDPGLGDGYAPAEQLEILQRLLLYWGDNPPRRKHVRTRLAASVEVVFGLDAVMRVVDKLKQSIATEKFEILFDDKRAPAEKPAGAVFETWTLKDISLRGLGALTTRRAQGSLKIGALLAFRLENTENWCVGIVRRLQIDRQKNSDVGAEILSRNPQLFWLKKPDSPIEDAWQWETRRDDKTAHHFLKTVLLPYDKETAVEESMLVDSDSYVLEQPYTAQVDTTIGHLHFTKVLEQGENFERLAFEWID